MANKNEAKIKFTAETGEFNAAIKQSESTMKVLRAELKLNETQMKATGATVEGLEEKHQILQKQLKASEDKTEALSNKLEAAARIYGENSAEVDKWRTQLLNAQSAQERLRQDVSRCENDLNDLKNATGDAGDAMNKAADDAKRLDQSVEDAGDSARGAGDGFTVMKGIVANLASEAIQFAIDKVSDFISYLGELPEATREFRQDMATLVTSFDTAGFSADTAKETWKDLYRIFGEDDRAVEAANLIAKMADDQKDLSNWTKIAMGIWGEYQDSLAVEALMEAINETVKAGTVTGNLADALNWSTEAAEMFADYMGGDVVTAEDAFNEALSTTSTEAFRHDFIMRTLLALYGDSAEKYAEVSGAQLEAKDATAELALAEAEMAAAIEPVTTAWDGLKAELMTAALPAIEAVCGVLSDALGWLQEHPAVIDTVVQATGYLAAGFAAVGAAAALMNAPLMTIIGVAAMVVAGLTALWAVGVGVVAGIQGTLVNFSTALSGVGQIISGLFSLIVGIVTLDGSAIVSAAQGIYDGIVNVFSGLLSGTIGFVIEFVSGVIDYFTSLWDTLVGHSIVPDTINGVISCFGGLWGGVSGPLSSFHSSVIGVFENVKSGISGAIDGAKTAVQSGLDAISNAFDGFSWSLPDMELPHFSISPPGWKIGDLMEGVLPELSIDWYAKGAIFTKPTMFATPFGYKGVGEAGAEAVLPIEKLEGYIMGAIEKTQQQADLRMLAAAIEDLANRPIWMDINGKRFATATAGDGDSVNGLRSVFKDRGLAI